MRIAGVFTSRGNRTGSFIPANQLQAIVVRPGLRNLQAVRYAVTPNENGVDIGATCWPEGLEVTPQESLDNEMFERLLKTACPVLSANIAWTCAKNPAGKYVSVVSAKRHDPRADADGNTYADNQVEHWYFDSNLYHRAVKAEQAGKPVEIPQGYFDWMKSQISSSGNVNSKLIDRGQPIGKTMADVTDNIFFSEMPVGKELPVPEMFYRTRENLEIDMDGVDRHIEKVMRSGEEFMCELAPFKGVVVAIEPGEDSFSIYLHRITVNVNEETGEPVYKVGEVWEVITVPDRDGVAEILIEAQPDLEPGEVITEDQIVHEFTPMFKLVNDSVNIKPADLRMYLGEDLYEWLQQQTINHLKPVYNGSPMYALSILKALPANVDVREFYTLNQTVPFVLNTDERALIGENGLVKYNLFHHPWHRTSQKRSTHAVERLRVPSTAV